MRVRRIPGGVWGVGPRQFLAIRIADAGGDRDRERMSSDRGDRSEDEDQRQTYYAISSYTAVEDSQVASYMGFQILHFVCIDNI